MKAIRVRFFGATAKLPCRLVADDGEGHRATYRAVDVTAEDQRRAAAEGLCEKMGWDGAADLIRGEFGQESYFVFQPMRIEVAKVIDAARAVTKADAEDESSDKLWDAIALLRETIGEPAPDRDDDWEAE